MQTSTSFRSSGAPSGCLTNGPKYQLAACLTSIIATGFLLIACDGDVTADNVGDRRIPVTLAHPKPAVAPVDLLVPVAFLGPSAFPTSIENRQGGEHEKVLIQFSYPSMKPLTGLPSTENEMSVYAEVYAAMRGATRSYADSELSLLKKAYDRSGDKVCELEEYKSKTIFGHADRKHHAWIYYYYRDPSDAVDDVYIHCGDTPQVDGPKCRHHFETEAGLQVVINLVRRSQLCQWSEITAQVGDFLDGFVVVE